MAPGYECQYSIVDESFKTIAVTKARVCELRLHGMRSDKRVCFNWNKPAAVHKCSIHKQLEAQGK